MEALEYIHSKLKDMWRSGECYPALNRVLLPFHMIGPEEVRLVIVCKQPYRNAHLATGIPVETDGTFETPSSGIFMEAISRYWRNVNNKNFMKCYYASGILVINAAFTSQHLVDKRYSMNVSHMPLWTRFCRPLLVYLNSLRVPILGLGIEGRGLLRNMNNPDCTYRCPFPKDDTTSREFMNMYDRLAREYLFNV
jgi:uracil DNA glycosylase